MSQWWCFLALLQILTTSCDFNRCDATLPPAAWVAVPSMQSRTSRWSNLELDGRIPWSRTTAASVSSATKHLQAPLQGSAMEETIGPVMREQSQQSSSKKKQKINQKAKEHKNDLFLEDATLLPETFSELYSERIHEQTLQSDSDKIETPIDNPTLPPWLVNRLHELNYAHPTLIQKRALDVILSGQDAMIHAQTGSGKTLAYLLPLLAQVDPSRSAVQALVVVPTRELGLQVGKVARRLCAASVQHQEEQEEQNNQNNNNRSSKKKKKIMVMNVLQGSQNKRQRAWAWSDPPHIVIGTPSELTTMVARGAIKYKAVRFVVVDEVDACLLHHSATTVVSGAAVQEDVTKSGNVVLDRGGGGALHLLLSRYLSPTYMDEHQDDSDTLLPNSLDASTPMTASSSSSSSTHSANGMSTTLGTKKRRAHLHTTPSLTSPTFTILRRQTILVSATIPQHHHFLKRCVSMGWTTGSQDLVHVYTSRGESMPRTLTHVYVVCQRPEEKLTALRRLLRRAAGKSKDPSTGSKTQEEREFHGKVSLAGQKLGRMLLFCNPGRPMEEMAAALAHDLQGVVWNEFSGSRLNDGSEHPTPKAIVSVLRYQDSISARAAAMDAFRGGEFLSRGMKTVHEDGDSDTKEPLSEIQRDDEQLGSSSNASSDTPPIRIMLSTDLAARGLDVGNITHVCNLDLPPNADSYVHRGGRAGRMGQKGVVLSIVSSSEEFVLQRLGNKLDLCQEGEIGGAGGLLKCIARQQKRKKRK